MHTYYSTHTLSIHIMIHYTYIYSHAHTYKHTFIHKYNTHTRAHPRILFMYYVCTYISTCTHFCFTFFFFFFEDYLYFTEKISLINRSVHILCHGHKCTTAHSGCVFEYLFVYFYVSWLCMFVSTHLMHTYAGICVRYAKVKKKCCK